MEQEIFFTTGQFARLHNLNKRTLHYYDEVQIFSPAHKGANGYRYYTYRQSTELENILALRELGMSIEEIKAYLEHPNMDDFMKIAVQKTAEINRQISRLKDLKAVLQEKQHALTLCAERNDGTIEVVTQKQTYLLQTPIQITDDIFADLTPIMEPVMTHLHTAWEYNAYKTGCGSYISIEKARQRDFDIYDGLFTHIGKPGKQDNVLVRPEGKYLRGYCIGDWNRLPALYERMLSFADTEHLTLTGNCYETGLNEFAISHMEEYMTQIEIQCM